jgi:hypothetical protein
MDASLLKRIDDLEQRKRELRQELDDIQKTDTASNPQAERKAELGRELERLRLDSDTLVKESGGK